jgi:AICAR transformylase/IMP cyclohydrolase PurH (only IMP cyclohydrolase domain in Aful)
VVVKHAKPCGVAIAQDIDQAFAKAWAADSKSAFGGIVALNRNVTTEIANKLSEVFVEIVMAPDYAPEALNILANKPNLRLLKLPKPSCQMSWQYRSIDGGFLVQAHKALGNHSDQWQIVTQTPCELETCNFAWQVCKHIQSNGIVIVKDQMTYGIGQGQVSRVDAVKIALMKASEYSRDLNGAILASDAFFPFRDNIDLLADTGIKTIIQPGGSKRDQEVIAACDAIGIAMVFTGQRCFTH